MKAHENSHVKGIFHHDKNNRMKFYIYIFSKHVFQVCRTLFCENPSPFLLKTIFLFIGYIFTLYFIFFQNTLL